MPWPRNPLTKNGWAYPSEYGKRKFCSRKCHADFMRGAPHRVAEAYPPLSVQPVDTSPVRNHVDVLARPLRFRDAITVCPKCVATALRELAVGRQCITCGTLVFCRDGDWVTEAARRQQTGYD